MDGDNASTKRLRGDKRTSEYLFLSFIAGAMLGTAIQTHLSHKTRLHDMVLKQLDLSVVFGYQFWM